MLGQPPPCNPIRTNSVPKLRELARWYRDFAEQAGSSATWEARLRTAEQLDDEADALERARTRKAPEEKAVRVTRVVVVARTGADFRTT